MGTDAACCRDWLGWAEGLADLELLREPLLPEDLIPPALAWALSSITVTLTNNMAAITIHTLTILFFIYSPLSVC
jgi:hypothetical protein